MLRHFLDVLLPRLEELQTTGRDILSADERIRLFNSIQHSLKHDVVASAILAPAIDEVDVDGSEVQTSNPVGLRLVRCFVSEIQDDKCEVAAIECLSLIVRSQIRVEGNKGVQDKVAHEWDARIVYKLFENSLQRRELDKVFSAIRLCEVLMRRSSNWSSSLLSAVLSSSATVKSRSEVCRNCGVQSMSLSSWMRALHRGMSSIDTDRALVRCTIKLLEDTPLTIWLRESSRPSRTTVTGFRDKIHASLISMIWTCICRLGRQTCDSADIEWSACLLRQIPYETSTDLTTCAVALVVKILSLWKKQNTVLVPLHALLKNMGGEITPRGNLTKMSLPLQTWFLSEAGKKTIREILEGDEPHGDLSEHEFLRNAVRTLPLIVLGEYVVWNSFVWYIDKCDTMVSANTSGPSVLCALLQGRRDFGEDRMSVKAGEVMPDIAPRLKTWLESHDTTRQMTALTCYSLLHQCDWTILVDSETFQQHLDLILSCCAVEKAEQKMRSDTYRNLGEICSNLLFAFGATGDVDALTDFCENVCRLFLAGLTAHKNVGSMAMFGLGNLAQALTTAERRNLLRPESLKLLGTSVCEKLDSEDPKIASNTIRAASHAVCLLCQDKCHEGFSGKTVERVLQALSLRIHEAFVLSHGESSCLSWKQRSAAKKLGWGACNALATICSASTPSLVYMAPTFPICVERLFLCLGEMQTMNDKIVAASLTAILSINPDVLGKVTEGKTYFAQSFVGLLCGFSNTSREKSKNAIDRDATLRRLLGVCTVAGARAVVDLLAATPGGLGRLYEWMVRSELSAEIWGKVALSMQQSSFVDVSWEQRFANRAQLLLQPEITDEL